MTKINTLTIMQLKGILQEEGLPTTGNKAELMARLQGHLQSDEIVLSEASGNENDNLRQTNWELQKQIEDLRRLVESLNSNNAATNDIRRQSTTNCETASNNTVANGQKACFSVKEIAEMFPEYDPSSEGTITVEQFVERVNAAISLYGWSDKSVLLAVCSRLKGVARLWLDASATMHQSWEQLADELITEFGCEYNEAEVCTFPHD